MVPAPILNDAIRMVTLVIFISVLGVGAHPKKAKQANRAHCQSNGQKFISHDRSPMFQPGIRPMAIPLREFYQTVCRELVIRDSRTRCEY
jgi:hypothetical protein